MTSAIDNTFLTSINEGYPVQGVNNSSSGFRTNFAQIKQGLQIAGKELTYLQAKQIEVIGDATGISGVLGNSLSQPTPITLTLADTTVTAGSYNTLGNTLSFTVDSKGRLTAVALTPVPTRPAVVGTFTTSATTNTSGFVSSISVPTLTVDNYGTITAAANNSATFNFGLKDHALPLGNILIGDNTGKAKEFPLPGISYNPSDIYALAWRPEVGNTQSVAWVKIPTPPAANPAQLISVQGGPGIHVDTNVTDPTISFDITEYPEYPSLNPLDGTSHIMFRDAITNSEYRLPMERIFELTPSGLTPLYNLVEDFNPELGGILDVNYHRIRGTHSVYGITLETHDTGGVRLAHTSTVDFSTDPPSTLDESLWTTKYQKLPLDPPTFTQEQTDAGIDSAILKSGTDGNWYWSPSPADTTSVSEIIRGPGLRFSPGTESITTSGTIEVNFFEEPEQAPDIYSDILPLMDYTQILYKQVPANLTWTMPQVRFVDPINGSDDITAPNAGHINQPYATIQTAIANIDPLSISENVIMLMPGIYSEPSVKINRPNVQLISMFGPHLTKVEGGFVYDPVVEDLIDPIDFGRSIIKGVDFRIDTIELDAPDRVLTALSGIGSLFVEDCWFKQAPENNGILREIIRLEGPQRGDVRFEGCKFNGEFYNNLVLDDPDLLYEGTVRITNVKYEQGYQLTLITGAGTRTTLENAPVIRQVVHHGGRLELKNIAGIKGEWTSTEWSTSAPDHPLTAGYLPTGIISDAASSTSPWNVLLMENVNMRYLFQSSNFLYSKINKSGTCQYAMSNVTRQPNVDSFAGVRVDNFSTPKSDIVDNVHTANVSSTYTIASDKASTYDLTLTGSTTFSLSAPSLVPNTYATTNANAHTVRVLLRQDAVGSHAITFSSVQWHQSSTPSFPTGANQKVLLEFQYIAGTWFGRVMVSDT